VLSYTAVALKSLFKSSTSVNVSYNVASVVGVGCNCVHSTDFLRRAAPPKAAGLESSLHTVFKAKVAPFLYLTWGVVLSGCIVLLFPFHERAQICHVGNRFTLIKEKEPLWYRVP
jgi:hypothetical protein